MKSAIAVVVGSILIGLMLTGCATTQSGQPRVTFNTTDRGKIKSAIINEFENMDFKVVSESYDSLVLEGRRLGYTGSDKMHAIFNMVTTGDSTIVIVQAYLKTSVEYGKVIYSEVITYGITGTELLRILQRIKVQVESP